MDLDELRDVLANSGPKAAIDRLCSTLQERKDYPNLFYALLMKKRYLLGVSPIPSGPSSDLPAETHQPYEEGIREAAREVGRLFLNDGNIPNAWPYFQMIGEPEPVKQALELVTPTDENMQPLVDIAYYQGVHPRQGFDWILDRHGICNAITTVSTQDVNVPADVRDHCLRRVVRTLHAELVARLSNAVAQREGLTKAGESQQNIGARSEVTTLLNTNPWLGDEEFPHIDTSHLSAVVQMSLYLSSREELALARELCAYGQRLPEPFRQSGDSPFEDFYRDHDVYLSALAGEEPDRAVAHFRRKIGSEKDSTRPAEVVVNLLLRLDRPKEALAVARHHLSTSVRQQLTCPGLIELCQRAKDYSVLAEVAREQGDPVHSWLG